RRSSWRRHVPVALLAAALVVLAGAAARPRVRVEVPLSRTSIVLALDVSQSMCSTDVEPNRLTVAEDAVRTFVEEQADGTRIGIVAFAGIAQLSVAPTTDRDQLVEALESFTTSRGTAIGEATLTAVDAIAEDNPDVDPTGVEVDDVTGAGPGGVGGGADASYVPDIVVLLTDGANSQGVDPIVAAEEAAARGVRVYTIGFGTTEPNRMVCSPDQLGADALGDGGGWGGGWGGRGDDGGGGGWGGGGGFQRFLVIDEDSLMTVADLTGGEYDRAEDAEQLTSVFDDLPRQVEVQQEEREISVAFVAIGSVLVLGALVLSLRWNRLG
ncbi:MAG: VWA domain-containing protein, partial [Actinomycetota bacterium]|nr:VWA domain-containing protein [Actinomycetota bacterium]